MRLLADECIRRSTVLPLRGAEHDVLWARDAMAGATDETLVGKAHDDDRILLTADKDFGEIGLRDQRKLPGIILLRFPTAAWDAATESVLRLLKLAEADLRDRVVVLSPGRARFRRLHGRG